MNEETLKNAVVKAINKVLCSKNTFLHTLQDNIATVLHEENDKSTVAIDKKLEELQKELLQLANSKADYNNVADEIYRLQELKQNTLVQHAECQGKRQRIAEMAEFLKEQSIELLDYDEQLIRRLIEKITVVDDHLNIEFKANVEIEIER